MRRGRGGVKVGDRVALEPHLSCGRCWLCLGGDYHNCRSLMPPGAPPCYGYTPRDVGHGLWGGYGEYIHLHERTMLHKVPEAMPLGLATLYQPIAAGVRWAVQVPKTAMGDTILILGHGQRGAGRGGRRARGRREDDHRHRDLAQRLQAAPGRGAGRRITPLRPTARTSSNA